MPEQQPRVRMEMPEPIFRRLRPSNALERHGGSSRSAHGGLWTDLQQAHEILAAKHVRGEIDAAEREKLGYFIDNGYVVLEKLVPEALIDTHLEDMDRIARGLVPGHFVEYFEGGQHLHGAPFTPELVGKRFKLIDAYARTQSALHLSLHAGLTRFLSLVFEQAPLAFQSLSFFTGSGQSMHQDTSYVRVDSPLELTASWIALEDIEEGSGELEFFAGSQRLPDYDFPGNPGLRGWFEPGRSRWFDRQDFEEHARYIRWIQDEAARMRLERRRFLARKGDVLIWTNDFAHGGSPVTKPDRSRLSYVTHYCPVNRSPYYFYTRAHAPKIRHDDSSWYTWVDHAGDAVPLDFDPERYLAINPDVRRAGADPRRHYIYHGKSEKRRYN